MIEFKQCIYLLKTSHAVSLCLGSEFNIFLTRSFAAGEMEGHGSLEKSTWPLRMALNIPFSDSVKNQILISVSNYADIKSIQEKIK
jgi:hypothetical protein